MIFYYDSIEAEKLILEFTCNSCHRTIVTDKLQVPEINYDDFLTHTLSYQQVCECGRKYIISIHNGIHANYGEISDYEKGKNDIIVHEIPFYPYGKETIITDSIHAFTIIDSIIEEITNKMIGNDTFLYNLLFSYMISLVDSFIKIYAEPIVLSNQIFITRFVEVFKSKRKDESEQDYVKRFFSEKSFQNPSNQILLIYVIFRSKTKYKFRKELFHYVRIRNLLIHRNGIHKDGYMYNISREELLSASTIIKNHIKSIFQILFEIESDLEVRRIFDNKKN